MGSIRHWPGRRSPNARCSRALRALIGSRRRSFPSISIKLNAYNIASGLRQRPLRREWKARRVRGRHEDMPRNIVSARVKRKWNRKSRNESLQWRPWCRAASRDWRARQLLGPGKPPPSAPPGPSLRYLEAFESYPLRSAARTAVLPKWRGETWILAGAVMGMLTISRYDTEGRLSA